MALTGQAHVTSLYRTLSVDTALNDDEDSRTLSTFAKETADNDREPLGALLSPTERCNRTALTHAHETVDNDRDAVISTLDGDVSHAHIARSTPYDATITRLYRSLARPSPDPFDATRTETTKQKETVDNDQEAMSTSLLAGRHAESRTRITERREQVDADDAAAVHSL